MVAIAADAVLIPVDAAVVDLDTIAADSLLITADAAFVLPDAVVEPVAMCARGHARNNVAAARCCAAAETSMQACEASSERDPIVVAFLFGPAGAFFFYGGFSPKHL
jgi:hypothetical protein